MSRALRRGGLLVFGVVAIGVLAWNIAPVPSESGGAQSQLHSPVPLPAATLSSPLPQAGPQATTRDYAIALDELQGFPSDLQPGATVELWVGWDRPSGAGPKLQRLMPRAAFVRLVAPVTPGGPTAVVLRVPLARVPDLLWADGYGSLSATVVP